MITSQASHVVKIYTKVESFFISLNVQIPLENLWEFKKYHYLLSLKITENKVFKIQIFIIQKEAQVCNC